MGGTSFTGNPESYVKKAVYTGAPLGNLEGVGTLYWGLRQTSQCRLWKWSSEGSYTEDSERHVLEGSGNGAFIFIGVPQGEPKGT